MAGKDDKCYLFFFRIDGIPFSGRTLTADRHSANWHAQQLVNQRNANVNGERGELVVVYEVGTDITQEQADQMEAANALQKEQAGLTAPTDIDEDFPNRILHTPIGQPIGSFYGTFPTGGGFSPRF